MGADIGARHLQVCGQGAVKDLDHQSPRRTGIAVVLSFRQSCCDGHPLVSPRAEPSLRPPHGGTSASDIGHHPLGLQKRLPGQATLVNRNALVVVVVVFVLVLLPSHFAFGPLRDGWVGGVLCGRGGCGAAPVHTPHVNSPGQNSSFDFAVLSCTSESFKREETRRCSTATRSLESDGRHDRSTETKRRLFLDLEQVAE